MTALIERTVNAPAIVRRRKPHLHQIDVVRVVTFASVIGAHVISTVNGVDNANTDALTMALHFTRNAFFFLTALVLVHTFRHRELAVRSFWRKRIAAVGIPYLLWTVIYTWYNGTQLGLGELADQVGQNVLNGGAMYQLYFLVVSIQFYLVFPAFLWLMRLTRNHPFLTLSAAALGQAALNSYQTYATPPEGGLAATLWQNNGTMLPSYLFYLVLGGVAAMHVEAFTVWVRTHTGTIVVACVSSFALFTVVYFHDLSAGVTPFAASTPQHPTLIPWCASMAIAVYAIGTAWGARRREGSWSAKFFAAGTDRAFGIFLSHPLVLALLSDQVLPLLPPLPTASVTIGTYLATVALSLTLVAALRQTPLSKHLTGRAPSYRFLPESSARAAGTNSVG